jgi:hypothetical protein
MLLAILVLPYWVEDTAAPELTGSLAQLGAQLRAHRHSASALRRCRHSRATWGPCLFVLTIRLLLWLARFLLSPSFQLPLPENAAYWHGQHQFQLSASLPFRPSFAARARIDLRPLGWAGETWFNAQLQWTSTFKNIASHRWFFSPILFRPFSPFSDRFSHFPSNKESRHQSLTIGNLNDNAWCGKCDEFDIRLILCRSEIIHYTR